MTVVYSMKEGMELQPIIDESVKMIPVWDNRNKLHKYIDLCFGIITRFQRNIFRYIKPNEYDTVVFNNSDVSSGLIKKFKKLGLRIITIHHNYQIEYLRGDSRPYILVPSILWTCIYERQAVKNSTLNLALTWDDVKLLTSHYGKSNFNVLSVFEYKASTHQRYSDTPRGHRYVITGWLGSKQTEDSLVPWIKNYYPILKEEDPLAELIIAGRDPSTNLMSFAKSNGITIIASPIDMQPILDDSDYYICPTDRGGGLKLRNMDGLKSGLPVLTHAVSARGYEYMQNLGVLYSYNDLKSFREGIKHLMLCNQSRMEIIQHYKDYYSLEAGVNRLKYILKASRNFSSICK